MKFMDRMEQLRQDLNKRYGLKLTLDDILNWVQQHVNYRRRKDNRKDL